MIGTCPTCPHFRHAYGPHTGAGASGHCHANPPKVFQEQATLTATYNYLTQWPYVEAKDWCGQHPVRKRLAAKGETVEDPSHRFNGD